MILNCIAVDDEPLALGLVCNFIQKTPFLNLIGQYSSGVEALQALHTLDVDLIYLDIQMPDLTGMELARILSQNNTKTKVIFTTAFNHFAIEGYRVNALDYLLKPFNYEEFLRASQKALQLSKPSVNPVKEQTNNTVSAATNDENYLFLKVEYQLLRISYDDIVYIEGLKDYVKVWLVNTDRAILSLISMKALEAKLPASRFMRVHRSFIISLEKIKSITRNTIQIGGITITVGDQHKASFTQFLSKWI